MSKQSVAGRAQTRSLLIVKVHDERYGLPLEHVVEVWPALPVESLPESPPSVVGLTFVREQLIPVVDAAVRLGRSGSRSVEDHHLVCLRVDGRLLALQVDEALDVDMFRPSDGGTNDLPAEPDQFCFGVCKSGDSVVRLLDPRSLRSELRMLPTVRV